MKVDLLLTWVVGLGCLTLALIPIFGERGKNSTGGDGRHVSETSMDAAAQTTVLQRFRNVLASFGPQDWGLMTSGVGFTLLAIWRSCALLLS